MDGPIDVVKGYPKDEIEEKHGPSNNAHQKIYLFVISKRTHLIIFLGEVSIDPVAGCILRREKPIVVKLPQPYDVGMVLTIAPGHDGKVHGGVSNVESDLVP